MKKELFKFFPVPIEKAYVALVPLQSITGARWDYTKNQIGQWSMVIVAVLFALTSVTTVLVITLPSNM